MLIAFVFVTAIGVETISALVLSSIYSWVDIIIVVE